MSCAIAEVFSRVPEFAIFYCPNLFCFCALLFSCTCSDCVRRSLSLVSTKVPGLQHLVIVGMHRMMFILSVSLVSCYPEKASAWHLRKFLLQHASPLSVSDSVLKQWLIAHNADVTQILSAADLDLRFGVTLRQHEFANASQLQSFLAREFRVSAQERTCNTWLTTDWSPWVFSWYPAASCEFFLLVRCMVVQFLASDSAFDWSHLFFVPLKTLIS